MALKLVYLSQGKLFFKENSKPCREIHSQFGQEVNERAIRIQQKNEWKRKGRGANFMSGGALWGADDADPRVLSHNFTGVSAGESDDELLFILQTDTVGGLFSYSWTSDKEKRFFHKENFRARDLYPPDSSFRNLSADGLEIFVY